MSRCMGASKHYVLVASRLLGLNPVGRAGRVYSSLALASFVVIASCNAVYNPIYTGVLPTPVARMNRWLHFSNLVLIALSGLITSIAKPRCFVPPFSVAQSVDSTLGTLGGKVSDGNQHRFQIFLVIFSFVTPVALSFPNIRDIIFQRPGFYITIVYMAQYVSALFVLNITTSLFAVSLLLIKTRFTVANNLMADLVDDVNGSKVLYQKDVDKIHATLVGLRKVHHDLWLIAQQVNHNFGLHMLVVIVLTFISITVQLYKSYYFYTSQQKSFADILLEDYPWIIYRFSVLVFASHISSITSTEAFKMSNLIHAIPLLRLATGFKDEIALFSHQLCHDKLTFTANGFFDINYRMLGSIVGSIASYFVIFIQMDGAKQI